MNAGSNPANDSNEQSPHRQPRNESRQLSQDEGEELSSQHQMAAHVFSKLQMLSEDDEREILQRVLKESLAMSQAVPVSQSTDRISMQQFNTFAQQFVDQQSESPIKGQCQKLAYSAPPQTAKSATFDRQSHAPKL